AERHSQLRRLESPAFGCGPSPSSAWVFNQFTPLRRLAIKIPVEQGHGTQSNRFGIKDLWPSASRFWKNQARVRNGQKPSREGAPGGLKRASGFPFPLENSVRRVFPSTASNGPSMATFDEVPRL